MGVAFGALSPSGWSGRRIRITVYGGVALAGYAAERVSSDQPRSRPVPPLGLS
jgi:hypothetical protein